MLEHLQKYKKQGKEEERKKEVVGYSIKDQFSIIS